MLHSQNEQAEQAEGKQHIVDERGVERERIHLRAGVDIRTSMMKNLKAQKWLRDFKPMPMHCPLLGRRVSWQAVSDYATLAWSCDGLGFAWECLHSPPNTDVQSR